MLKQLLSDNRIFGAIVCVIVCVAAGLVYLQSVKREAARDLQRTQERLQQRTPPQTGEVEPQPAPGGHYHPDGTYHAGPHENHASSDSTAPSLSGVTGATSQTDIQARTWTGKPLREVSSSDTLTPEQQKARDAEIRRLDAEIEKLKSDGASLINQASKLNDENLLTLIPKQDAIRAEQDAVRANKELSVEEKERLLTDLDKQHDELMVVRDANRDKARALNNEGRTLFEKRVALRIERDALAGR